jgi:hypothetical protein
MLQHLRVHLRETCAILARAIVRLRQGRTEGGVGPNAPEIGGEAEILLHFRSDQSGHAEQIPWRDA